MILEADCKETSVAFAQGSDKPISAVGSSLGNSKVILNSGRCAF